MILRSRGMENQGREIRGKEIQGKKIRVKENRKNRGTKNRGNRGMMTVEASVLIPTILLLLATAIVLYLTIGKRERLRGEETYRLYTIPIGAETDEDPMVRKGAVEFTNRLAASLGVTRKDFSFVVKREQDHCTERLRRWRFYGDIAEE